MKVSNVVNSRFLAAHYLLQVLTFMAFFGLRLKYPPTDLLVLDVLGYTREFTIWLSLGMVIVVRLFSSPTPDAIVSHAFKFTKVAMLVISYYMSKSLPIVFAGIWIAIFTLFPQPRAKDPKIVQILNRGNFDRKPEACFFAGSKADSQSLSYSASLSLSQRKLPTTITRDSGWFSSTRHGLLFARSLRLCSLPLLKSMIMCASSLERLMWVFGRILLRSTRSMLLAHPHNFPATSCSRLGRSPIDIPPLTRTEKPLPRTSPTPTGISLSRTCR
uniref:Uncharacterized protein n=1 Tax=Rhodosorus marinus TaxID=101924 RepID=A0A7S2ZQZ8_9RHOD|mmetsp:Transcript_29237/g.113433  ORF Transcript_29237/g.113433 Transcript_29237/m.113433 type:complete len:273 (+) Transcript_29237:58-876(+)